MSSLQNFPILHQLVLWAFLHTLVSYSAALDDLAFAIEPRNATPERELIELNSSTRFQVRYAASANVFRMSA
jgi:hypothetical protein